MIFGKTLMAAIRTKNQGSIGGTGRTPPLSQEGPLPLLLADRMCLASNVKDDVLLTFTFERNRPQ